MTVATTASRVVYSGNGSTTQFPFAFKVALASELAVVYTDATGDHVLTSGQYTVTGIGSDSGGTVTYAPDGLPIASGTRLTIYRDVPLTQPTSLNNQGAMWPSVIEGALDRLTWIAQKLADLVGRSLVVSPTDSGTLNPLPNAAQRANSVLGFDANGQPYAATLDSSVVAWSSWITANWVSVASAAAGRAVLSAVGLTNNETIAGSKTLTGTTDMTGGRAKVPTRPAGDDGTDAASTAFVQAKATAMLGGGALRSYLAGLGMANSSGTPNTEIDVAEGVCADANNVMMMALSATTLDCTGTGANGLDTGSLANSTWYHVFVIAKADGTTAVLGSTSASSPTMPADYVRKRRIGSFKTDGSAHILGFVQGGDYFRWKASVLDVNVTDPGNSGSVRVLASVPTGVRVFAILNLENLQVSGAFQHHVSDPAVDDEAPSTTAAPLGSIYPGTGSAAGNVGPIQVRTNASAGIRSHCTNAGASDVIRIATLGWIDRRGRDD